VSSPSGAVGTPGAAECKPTVKVSPPSGCSQERQQCDKSQATRPDLAHAAAAADCNTQHVEEQTREAARPASLLPVAVKVKVTPSLNVDTDVTQVAIRPLSDEAANSGRVTLKVDGDREQMEGETKEAARPASLLPANASVKVTQSRSVEANVIQEAGRPLTDKATTSGLVVTEVVKTNDDDLDSHTLARPTVATLVAARPRNSEAQSEPSESVVTWSRRTRRFLSQALWACWLAVVWLLTRAATPLSRWSKGHSVTSQPQLRVDSPRPPAHGVRNVGGDTQLSAPDCTITVAKKEEAASSLNPNAACFVPRVNNSLNHCDPSMVERSVIRAAAVDKTQSPDPHPPSLYVDGLLEGEKVRYLVDTGAEVSVISYATLAKLPREVQAAFQDQAHTMTVTTVSGEQVSTKGPVLCKISILGREVTDVVIAMHMESEAILSLPTLAAMGGEVKLGGVNLLPASSIRLVLNQRVFKVTVDKCEVIPARSQKVVSCRIRSRGQPVEQALIVEGTDECRQLKAFQVAHSVAKGSVGRTQVRLLNPTDKDVKVKAGLHIANASPGQVLASLEEKLPSVDWPTEVPDHLNELYKTTCEREKLSVDMRNDLKLLLCKHASLFAKHDKDLGRTSLVEHDIDTGDSKPIRQPPRRLAIALQEDAEKEINAMLEADVIERGQSPWSSPVVLVRKADGSIRFCVDYRALNAVTKFDAYPLPRIDETLEALAGAKYFSTLDLISGYWQVGLTERAKLKSAFVTRSGLYLWKVMPFGLAGAVSCFERLMESVLQGLQWKTALIYLDDVIVHAKTEQEMISRLDEVFSRLQQAGLKLKPRKCKLFARQTEFLGHVVSEEGVAVNPDKVRAVKEWPTPECATDVRSFLGTASYYRRFVRGFATIAAPLHRLTEVKATWEWKEEHQRAFDLLKAALADTPVLQFPVADAPFVLDTDASSTGVGAVLSQIVDGQERVLGYASRALSRRERNYCVTRRELLSVVTFVKTFRPYLYGKKFIIRTDHASLQWLKNFKEPEGQLARWLERLQEYKFDIVHRPGKKHGNADGLSRQRCAQCARTHEDPRPKRIRLVTIRPRWSAEEFAAAQQSDPDLAVFVKAFQSNKKPTSVEESAWPPAARHYLRDWNRLSMVNGVLARQWFNSQGEPTHMQWVAPRKFVTEILEQAHASASAAHMADKRTLARVREAFFWHSMSVDTRDFCRGCMVCKGRKRKPTVPHHVYERQVTTEPLQRVAVDILALDPPTKRGNRYVLVIVDYFTKWMEALPMTNQRAKTCIKKFVTQFVCRFGIPDQCQSDQGVQFESKIMEGVCRLLGINKTRTTPLHPESDGQTERANSTLLDMIAKLAVDDPKNWDEKLPYACMAYNSSVHSVTGETPNKLMLCRELRVPLTLLAPPAPGQRKEVAWVDRQRTVLRETFAKVAERTKAQHRAEVPRLYKRQRGYTFKVGDRVSLYDPKSLEGVSHKINAHKWSGPWEVTKCLSSIVYAIKEIGTKRTKVVNVDRLYPYHDLDPVRFPPAQHAIDRRKMDKSRVPTPHPGADDSPGVIGDGHLPDLGYIDKLSNDGNSDNEPPEEPPVDSTLSSPVTKRAERCKRPPTRLRDYEVEWE
jgi:hypothetical protein